MEVKGKVEFISTLEKGQDKNGKDFEKAYFIVNEGNGQYPNKYKVELFNKTDLMRGVSINSDVTVKCNANVNEWQGKHYMSLQAYNLELGQSTPVQTTTAPPAPVQTAPPAPGTSLPF